MHAPSRQTEKPYRKTVTQEAAGPQSRALRRSEGRLSLFPFNSRSAQRPGHRKQAAEPVANNGQSIDQPRNLFDTERANGPHHDRCVPSTTTKTTR